MSTAFTLDITSEQLKKGLRPSSRVQRDSKFLVIAQSVVGRDGVLEVIDELTRIDTSVITDAFPFPQLFVFTNLVIICSAKVVYEYTGGELVVKYTASAASGTWSAVDFYDFVYLSNGSVAVVRDALTKVYSTSSTLPSATAILNYNGQVIVGAPDQSGLGASLCVDADSIEVTTTQIGDLS